MGWAGSRIKATRRHVAMPRRWAWLAFEPDDVRQETIDDEAVMVPHHCRLSHSRILDGRMIHGDTYRWTPADMWDAFEVWAPPRGGLWIFTGQPELAPRGVGLDVDIAGRHGWKRGHTRFGDETFHVCWTRGKSRVTIASVQGLIRRWEAEGRPWIDAVRDDVIAWAMVVEHQGLGHFRATVGAQGWEAYRARWCDGSLYAGGSDPHKAIAREAIAGGIAMAFQEGKLPGDWYSVDMSRCYRSVMADEYLPMRAVSRLRRPGLPILEKALSRDCVIATVTLQERGLIAAGRDEYGRLHWAGGPGMATLTTPDLIDAFHARAIDSVVEMCTWTRGRPLRALGQGLADLESWIPPDSPGLLKRQIKLLANSVYGRMAMRSRRWRKIDKVDDDGLRAWSHWNMDEKRHERFRQIGPIIEREDAPCEHRWGHAAAAAHIAAHGRARLRRLIDRAGRENVAYIDTDGLVVNEQGLIQLQECELWDDWRLRIDAQGSVCIRGVRDYDIGDKRVQSGAPRKGV